LCWIEPRILFLVLLHVHDWYFVIIWWGDYIFRLCCNHYASGPYHVWHLWVVPHVPEGIGWSGYDSIWCAMSIWSSFLSFMLFYDGFMRTSTAYYFTYMGS
jgi:hypothetical protein